MYGYKFLISEVTRFWLYFIMAIDPRSGPSMAIDELNIKMQIDSRY